MKRPLMTAAERQTRIAEIVDRARRGSQPTDIAKRYGLTTKYVRNLLYAKGIDYHRKQVPSRTDVNRMWDVDEDLRRRMIARHAAKGARATLRAMAVASVGMPTK